VKRIAIMPARGGSKRIPRKNIVPFCGKPLMIHCLEAARASGLFDEIHVSTDDVEIFATAEAHGFPPGFLRDPTLADDYTPIRPVLRWVIEQFAGQGRSFDVCALLFPTAPLIEASDLTAAAALLEKDGLSRPVMAVSRFPCPVEWAFRRGEDGGLTEVMPGKSEIRSQDLEEAWYDTGTFSLFPVAALKSDGAAGFLGYPLDRHKAVDIDTVDDLDLAERLFRGRVG
jgi:N-acylneuraminate cytidylyltransferase